MDKYEQIGKLAEAHALIQEVINVCDPDFKEDLQYIADNIAGTADQIEGNE
jgi:hypothetical protein